MANTRVRLASVWRPVGAILEPEPPPPPPPPPPPDGDVINALADPSFWGWPDETNTGVPAGTTLTPAGSITVSTSLTVIQDQDIAGGVTINGASGVVIRRCRIHRQATPGFGCVRLQNGAQVTIEDCEIFYEPPFDAADAAIGGSGAATIRRCNIHHVTEGPRMSSGWTVEDSYLHHMQRLTGGGGHHDLLQTTAGTGLVVHHNTLLSYNADIDDPFNACGIFKADNGPVTNVQFTNNLLNGGNFSVYFNTANFQTSNVTATGNRWGRAFRFGPASIVNVTDLVWSNNVWDDDNTAVTG